MINFWKWPIETTLLFCFHCTGNTLISSYIVLPFLLIIFSIDLYTRTEILKKEELLKVVFIIWIKQITDKWCVISYALLSHCRARIYENNFLDVSPRSLDWYLKKYLTTCTKNLTAWHTFEHTQIVLTQKSRRRL